MDGELAPTAAGLASGGRLRLLIGAALVNVCLGSLYAWSLFVEPLRAAFGASDAALSSVFSVAVVMFAGVVLAGGRLADRMPPRRVVAAAAVAALAGMLVAAAAGALPWVAVGYGGLFGVANGLGYSAAVAVGGKAFGRHRGLALGIIVGAYALGPLLASPAITALLAGSGWRGTFVVLGVVIGALLLLAAGLLGDVIPLVPEPGGSARAGRHTGAGQDRATGHGPAVGRPAQRPLLRQPRGVLVWLGFLLGSLPAMMVISHAATIAGNAGLSRSAASAAVAALAAGNLLGRTGGGWVSDHVGRLPGLRLATAVLAATCVALSVAAGTMPVIVLLTTVGATYGAQASLVPAITADLFGARDFGANFGRVFTGWGVAGLVGPQVGARVSDTLGAFPVALWLGAVSAVGALLVYVVLPRAGRSADDRRAAGA